MTPFTKVRKRHMFFISFLFLIPRAAIKEVSLSKRNATTTNVLKSNVSQQNLFASQFQQVFLQPARRVAGVAN